MQQKIQNLLFFDTRRYKIEYAWEASFPREKEKKKERHHIIVCYWAVKKC
jgi:hypothetical protein